MDPTPKYADGTTKLQTTVASATPSTNKDGNWQPAGLQTEYIIHQAYSTVWGQI